MKIGESVKEKGTQSQKRRGEEVFFMDQRGDCHGYLGKRGSNLYILERKKKRRKRTSHKRSGLKNQAHGGERKL